MRFRSNKIEKHSVAMKKYTNTNTNTISNTNSNSNTNANDISNMKSNNKKSSSSGGDMPFKQGSTNTLPKSSKSSRTGVDADIVTKNNLNENTTTPHLDYRKPSRVQKDKIKRSRLKKEILICKKSCSVNNTRGPELASNNTNTLHMYNFIASFFRKMEFNGRVAELKKLESRKKTQKKLIEQLEFTEARRREIEERATMKADMKHSHHRSSGIVCKSESELKELEKAIKEKANRAAKREIRRMSSVVQISNAQREYLANGGKNMRLNSSSKSLIMPTEHTESTHPASSSESFSH